MEEETQGAIPEPQAAPEPEAAGWTPPTREEFQEIAQAYWQQQAQLAHAAAYIQNIESASQVEDDDFYADEDDEDDLDPTQVREMLVEAARTAVQESLNEHPLIRAQYEARGQQIADQAFTALEGKLGKFDHGLALTLAEGYAARYGIDPQRALIAGAAAAKQQADAARTAAIEEYRRQVETRLETPPDASAQGAATRRMGTRSTDSYEDAANAFIARRKAQMTVN